MFWQCFWRYKLRTPTFVSKKLKKSSSVEIRSFSRWIRIWSSFCLKPSKMTYVHKAYFLIIYLFGHVPFVICKHWDLCRRDRLPSRPEVDLRSTWGKCVKSVGKYHKLTWGRPEVDLRSTSRSTSSALGPPDYQKTQYMTLGPKFFCSSKMAATRRRKHRFQ